ncbi:DUF2076 domain-containing protein [Roseomonas marmotae]|uniref:DUF2076 domain-containing protein n=1 Tax=Roseomonas marmotae TaxID=2768161 RepID=A0ABS3K7C5_9PROT|nr:DUF2076 domain-containing protein [Roseomonas marmotae]MBO1073378.1 DUF2076 domain-containing protein [Roseomonas marmotae]QTI80422.1 DUF2076 domain-containing protein [Roseomonas marmotae]
MTEEERRIISAFVERMAGVAAPQQAASPWGGSSVPAVQSRPPLPPVDPEADQLIGDLFARYPEARYRLTQTAFVQEHALVQAQNRIQELEWQLENTQRQAQASQQSRGGLFGGMFGGGQQRPAPMTPRPEPIQPPMGSSPGMMQAGRGPSFLGSALTTAAGVAGGMVLGNALMGMFSGGAAEAATSAAGAAGDFAQEAVPASSPWTDPAQDTGYQDAAPTDGAGNWGNDAAADGGFDDAGFDEDI